MMKQTANKNRLTAVAIMMATAVTVLAQIPQGYYASLKGKKGAALKSAVHEIIKDAKVLDYGSGIGSTWDGFYDTDKLSDGQVVDRYSNDKRYFGNRGSVVGGMNIEHSFPKSWWGGTKNQAYMDLYNLMPCEQKINSSKSNYPMGEVTNASTDNGCTKVGTGTNGYKLWEPADKWKGDFARGYMYMATAYQHFSWSGTQALQLLQQGDYPTLKSWASELYIQWAKADKVSQMEIDRNEAVSKIQGNRNPFIDFPNLMEYIWGDSITKAFDPETTMKSTDYNNGGSGGEGGGDVPSEADILYDEDFTLDEGGCIFEFAVDPATSFDIWQNDSKYGWVANAYSSAEKKTYPADVTLWLPWIDLTKYAEGVLTFSHAVNFCTAPTDYLSVVAFTAEGKYVVLGDITWPEGNSWTFVESGEVSLNEVVGHSVRIGFRYTSTADLAPAWEIASAQVYASGVNTSISNIMEQRADTERPAYDLSGRRVMQPKKGQLLITGKGKRIY